MTTIQMALQEALPEVMAPRGKPSGFSELEFMEKFWRERAKDDPKAVIVGY